MSERGPKDVAGKVAWENFPLKECEEVVRVFEFGASDEGYKAPFTYRKGINVLKLMAATIRHCTAIQNGEIIDKKTGCLHAACVSANGLMMISQYQRHDQVICEQDKCDREGENIVVVQDEEDIYLWDQPVHIPPQACR